MADNPNASPVNSLPPVIVILVLAIVLVELVLTAGTRGYAGGPEAVGWRLAAIRDYGFSGEAFDWMFANNRYPLELFLRFVSYPFVHVSFTHAVFACVFVLALGKMVGEVFGAFSVLLIWFASSVVGALAYGLILNEPIFLVGAFPPVYGLIGAYTYLLWMNLAGVGQGRLRAFSLVGFLLGIQLLFGLLFGGSRDWVADIAGFGAGFALSFVVSPGGWRELVARLRQR
jgi:membrane associated rhomboid family serine protease